MERDQVGAETTEFFYLHPLSPLTDPAIVALFGARLGPLRAEATGPQQSADVVGMVDDVKAGADYLDDPSTGPETRAIACGFRPGHDRAHQVPSLGGGQLGRAPYDWPRLEARTTSPTIGAFPPPIYAEPSATACTGTSCWEQFDGADAAPLESRRAPLWAHAHLPRESKGHYLCRRHLADIVAAEPILKQLHFVASDELTGVPETRSAITDSLEPRFGRHLRRC